MEITWLGHACFRLRGRGATVAADPYGREIGLKTDRVSADVVTVSHGPGTTDLVAGTPRVVRGPGGYDIAGVAIEGIQATTPGDAARNTIFVITLDDLHVCHLGGLGRIPTAEQVDAIGRIDVLLAPVGPGAFLSDAELSQTIRALDPRLVVPAYFDGRAEAVETFCREAGEATLAVRPRLILTRDTLPEERRVAPLEPRCTAVAGRERRAA